MGTRESSEPSTQGAPFEIQKKEETFFDEYTESLTIYEEGSIGTEFVGNGLAESEKTISFSGNNGYGASQSAASRVEDSSDESGDANRDFSATQNQMLDLMHQDDQYSGTNKDLAFQDFGVNVPETHLDLGMGLNVSSGQAIRTKEDYEQRTEKRKQSNRESAKRSRLRRQQECEKLRATAETLQSEISEIPQKLWRLSEKCEKLNEENNDIIDELEKTYGPDAVSELKAAKVESFDGKSNSPEPFDGENNSAEPKSPSRDNSSPDPLMLSLGL
ncbi:hypothetical protein PRUPE_8G102100 [Prunus persica]|uniref:BZIP domain-containing protein n=1 Tax=Prunus persica TaxID=3760 RepID=A0A251MVZ6_PRUPE|nr:G-box-binding factor 1-like isoform X3 [Prunus persica]ONH91257.1 hypothetical protein PRUPE_8G102100 [Prunus persica]